MPEVDQDRCRFQEPRFTRRSLFCCGCSYKLDPLAGFTQIPASFFSEELHQVTAHLQELGAEDY